MRETYTNIEEAISGFGLDFTVEKTPLYTNINGILQQYDDKVATYRTDNELTLELSVNPMRLFRTLTSSEFFSSSQMRA